MEAAVYAGARTITLAASIASSMRPNGFTAPISASASERSSRSPGRCAGG